MAPIKKKNAILNYTISPQGKVVCGQHLCIRQGIKKSGEWQG